MIRLASSGVRSSILGLSFRSVMMVTVCSKASLSGINGRSVPQRAHQAAMGGVSWAGLGWAVETFDSNHHPPPGLGMQGVKRVPSGQGPREPHHSARLERVRG